MGATGFYYNRNRFYSPALGRFLQRDPNETAMPLLTAMVSNGKTVGILLGAFDPNSHFGDGMNVYLYLGANPLNGFDPSGLYDPFQDVDDQIDDLTGHKLYALATLNEGARWVALGLQTASQIALSLIPGYGVYEAYQSVQIIRSGRGGLMDYMTVGLAGFSTGVTAFKAVKLIAKAAKWGQRGSRLSRAALKFKSFIKSNFRANLKILTGLDPPPNVHAHHMFPNKFANEFSARGINIHDPKYGAWWPGGEHLSAARGYNDLWADFFTGNPTAGQILERGRQLASRFGLEIGF